VGENVKTAYHETAEKIVPMDQRVTDGIEEQACAGAYQNKRDKCRYSHASQIIDAAG
jgi:hypothetical protein